MSKILFLTFQFVFRFKEHFCYLTGKKRLIDIITPMNFTMTNKFPRKYQFTPKIDYLAFFMKDKDIIPM
jgi:hypothetical protein